MINSTPSIDFLFENSIFMTVFNKIKTGNIVVDSIISTFTLYLLGKLCVHLNKIWDLISNINIDLLFEKNQITLYGKLFISHGLYDTVNTKIVCSDNFKAINKYLFDHLQDNLSIHNIRELVSDHSENDLFIIDQTKIVTLKKDIFIQISIISNDSESNDKKKVSFSEETIKYNLFSYKLSVSDINIFIKEITDNYLRNIEKDRRKKRFIYKLIKTPPKDDEWGKYECWMETPYHSTRNFDNLFFENKNEILNKINFFLQNKLWYEKMGIPYTLGIGLHGPPGTGKTSFIKALANFTDRHIIIISLKLLKKKYHLEEYFFETRYNLLNKKDSISFDNKIIVLEDIDCCDDIVLQRNDKKDNSLHDILVEKLSTKTEVNGVRTDKNEDSIYKSVLNEKEPDVTLDDLLNIIDGIQEATGRILIITSNFYSKLDDALTRPGRIDINMELKNTNHTTIREMYTHFFNKDIKDSDLKKIEEYKYSPAYLVNHFIKYNNNDKCILNNLFK